VSSFQDKFPHGYGFPGLTEATRGEEDSWVDGKVTVFTPKQKPEGAGGTVPRVLWGVHSFGSTDFSLRQ
jgi:hypothetical protein